MAVFNVKNIKSKLRLTISEVILEALLLMKIQRDIEIDK